MILINISLAINHGFRYVNAINNHYQFNQETAIEAHW